MAKTRRRRRRKRVPLSARIRDVVAGVPWLGLGRGVLNVAMLAGVLAGAAYGMPALEKYVSNLPEYDNALTIELVNPPEWLKANSHIADRILDRSGLTSVDRRLSKGLVHQVASEIGSIGWIKRVHEVSIGADDVVRICCDYREPVGWVAHGSHYYLIDAEQVRLPGRYLRSEVDRDSGLLLVLGACQPPPAEGHHWEGDDISAALRMIGLLRDRPYVNQVSGVIVANYGGRYDLREPHIELRTDKGTRIRWGRAPGEEIDEPTATQKLAHLQGIWRDHSRIDMNQEWIDIQIWPDRAKVPVSNWRKETRRRS